jgi:hypothetical protein
LNWDSSKFWNRGSQSPTGLFPGSFLYIPTSLEKIFSPARQGPFSYPEPFLRAVRRGALAKSISNWHLIGHNGGCCSNTGYILLPCFYGIRLWIWPEPLVAPRVRRALGTRMRYFMLRIGCCLSSIHNKILDFLVGVWEFFCFCIK